MPLAGPRTYWVVQEGYGPDDAVKVVLTEKADVCDLLEKAAELFSFEEIGKLLPSQLQVYIKDEQLSTRLVVSEAVTSSDTLIVRPKPGEIENLKQILARKAKETKLPTGRRKSQDRSTSPNRGQSRKHSKPVPKPTASTRTFSTPRKDHPGLANTTGGIHNRHFSSRAFDRPVASSKRHTTTHSVPLSRIASRTPNRTPTLVKRQSTALKQYAFPDGSSNTSNAFGATSTWESIVAARRSKFGDASRRSRSASRKSDIIGRDGLTLKRLADTQSFLAPGRRSYPSASAPQLPQRFEVSRHLLSPEPRNRSSTGSDDVMRRRKLDEERRRKEAGRKKREEKERRKQREAEQEDERKNKSDADKRRKEEFEAKRKRMEERRKADHEARKRHEQRRLSKEKLELEQQARKDRAELETKLAREKLNKSIIELEENEKNARDKLLQDEEVVHFELEETFDSDRSVIADLNRLAKGEQDDFFSEEASRRRDLELIEDEARNVVHATRSEHANKITARQLNKEREEALKRKREHELKEEARLREEFEKQERARLQALEDVASNSLTFSLPSDSPWKGKDSILGVMRHSIRHDMHGFDNVPLSVWPDKMHRPYDPPISDYDLPAEAGLKLKKYKFKVIVSSPYRRCLETAGIVARTIGVDVVHVDDRLGEWYREVARCCKGAGLKEAPLLRLSKEDAEKELGGGGVRLGEWNKVDIGLADTAGLVKRVTTAVPEICNKYGPTNVLLVSHGDIANRWLPEAEYIEEYSYLKLHEAGFVVLKGPHSKRSTEENILEQWRTESM